MADAGQETASVLDAVRSIVPTLRANGPEAERRGWIPDENIEILEKADVFRIAVPQRFGGLDLPVADQVDIVAEIARGCGSTGWVACAWVSSAWIASQYPDQAQEEIFAGGSVRISGGFTPTGTAVETEGGYVLNGSWRFNTGIRGADWNIYAAMLESKDGEPVEVFAVVPASEVEIADDWDVTAASGTGSFTTTVKDLFVPAHRMVDGIEVLEGLVGGRSNSGATGRNYGLTAYVMALSVPVFLGLARAALELTLERVPGKALAYTHWSDQSKHPHTQIQVGLAANRITAAEALAAGWARAMQQAADEGVQLEVAEKAAMRGQMGFAVQLAKEAVDTLHAVSSASVIARASAFQRVYRDIQGLYLHGLMNPLSSFEVHGRVLLGLEPDNDYL
ncbi:MULTISPECIES: acyl-CoA dehydrogenase family protein [unclassified Streptomyces]|uniref:acyl-CoA dehydrogenase family protein n=1 Tax=unclassified Streptomyces TaxID=2593676 RepID=UPI00081E3657|nr:MULTISPECIES: acyl-CoA dehydrogenase family protein [unclassified Streptomyces]MYZ38611.1 acyl-CoA dehydrogenase [Streptomyces sp. SID4917]SCF99491.1 Acyl-CoA dehydrogenase [Streptomyces sp. MnatMP-M17]